MNSKIIAPGVRLCTHKTEQFKTSVVSFNIITDLGENAGKKALLLNLLARTCRSYPTITEMNRRLAGLYGAVISPSVRKIGEAQVLSLVLVCLDDRFALMGEKVLGEALRLLSSCLFMPDITPEGFKEENIKREKRLLIEKLESELEELQNEIQKEENISDYVKLTELQEKIDETEMLLLETMEQLEELQNAMNEVLPS